MHTRCTHCDTAFRITPEVLTYARGRVRCGQCLRTFDALEHLAEEAGNVLVPATQTADSEAISNSPDAESASWDIPQDEGNTLEPEPLPSDTEHEAPDMEAVSPGEDQGDLGDEEDTLNAELPSSLPGDGGEGTEVDAVNEERGALEDNDKAESQQVSYIVEETVPEDREDALKAEPDFSYLEHHLAEAGAPVSEADGHGGEDKDDRPELQQDAWIVEETVSEAREDAFKVEPDFSYLEHHLPEAEAVVSEVDADTPEEVAITLDADHGPAEDEIDAAGAQQDVYVPEDDDFDSGRSPIADEDDTLDGDLDLAATNSWKLDEELLNTSSLPALPGLVEHPEIPEFQETPRDPVETAKPGPMLNWDDTWDDMSFDDEHGIPLMEDMEDVAETGNQAAVVADSGIEEFRLDPAATMTEADLPKADTPLQQQGETDPELTEVAWGRFIDAEELPAEDDVAGLPEEIDVPAIMVSDTDHDAIDSDLAELAEAIENAANMVADPRRGPGDNNAGNLMWTGPERDEGSAENGTHQAPLPGADIAKVQEELEDLAQLVGAVAGRKPGKSAKASPAENFEQIVRKRRSAWSIAATWLFSLLLVTVLGAQLIHYYRASLLPDAVWGPLIRQTYARLGIDLPKDWQLDRYDIRQLGGIQDPARPGVLVISISVRNQANRAQPFPVIRLVLEDRWGDRIAKRDLRPADYLDSEPGPDALMFAGQMIKTDIAVIEPEGAGATTFQVDACIENSGGTLDCANKL